MNKSQLVLLCYCILHYSNIFAMLSGNCDSSYPSADRTDQFSQRGQEFFINSQLQTEESLKVYDLQQAQTKAHRKITGLEEENKQLKMLLSKQKNRGLIGITLVAITSYIAYEVMKNKKELTPFQQK